MESGAHAGGNAYANQDQESHVLSTGATRDIENAMNVGLPIVLVQTLVDVAKKRKLSLNI
jgi:hypothetical protein